MDVKDTIRKLLNLAHDDGAMQGEIDNALRFARRLMLRHNISELDLAHDPHEQAADIEYGRSNFELDGSIVPQWETTLAWAIARLIGTVGFYAAKTNKRTEHGTLVFRKNGTPQPVKRFTFYGPIDDAQDAADMFGEWTHLIAAMARMKYTGTARGAGRSYCDGFSSSIHNKVTAQIKRELAIEGEQTMAVVATNAKAHELMAAKLSVARDWLKGQGINLRQGAAGKNSMYDPSAFMSGRADGDKVTFARTTTKKIGGPQ